MTAQHRELQTLKESARENKRALSARLVLVTLDQEQIEILRNLKGFGTKDAERIRNILIAYLSEKSYIKKASDS
jgi:hypothetical protein